jgi:hypothetical protein
MSRSLIAALLYVIAAVANAHEIRPTFLQLTESAPGEIDVLLKLPEFRSTGGVALVHPLFAPECREHARLPQRRGVESIIQNWRLICPSGLAGQPLRFEGFSALAPDALVVVRFADGSENQYALSQNRADAVLRRAGEEHAGAALSAYLPIGITHILLGADHLLFVLGLILVIWRAHAGFRVLVATITAFTLAHSLTLAVAVLGGVSLPSAPVEALIALSILLLAVELARAARAGAAADGLVFRKPWLVAFVFGLLHGFGFAGALAETGLPAAARGWALAMFNVGVELGQLMFIAAVLLVHGTVARAVQIPVTRMASWVTWLLGCLSSAWALDRALRIFSA